jgi:hypothetical protein
MQVVAQTVAAVLYLSLTTAYAQVPIEKIHPVCAHVVDLENRGQLKQALLSGQIGVDKHGVAYRVGKDNVRYSGQVDLNQDGRIDDVYIYLDRNANAEMLLAFHRDENEPTVIQIEPRSLRLPGPAQPRLLRFSARSYVVVRTGMVLDYVASIDRKFELRQICAIGQRGLASARSGRHFVMSNYDLLCEEANYDARALWELVLARAGGEKIALMLENGHSLNERVEDTTPLGLAVFHGQDAAVDLLLKLGASTDVRGAYGTPLADAILYGREQSVASLLKHGARSTGISNMDPLEMAITLERPEILQILLDAGFRASSRHLELAREQPEKRDQLVRILVGAISKRQGK